VRLVWTERAALSLEAIGAYISADDPVAAERWLARLVARAERAAAIPLSGRVVPEVRRDDVREVFVRRYRIVYQVRADAVYVLTVFEGSRLLQDADLEGIVDDDG
jgi:toxin ParE1/3/4